MKLHHRNFYNLVNGSIEFSTSRDERNQKIYEPLNHNKCYAKIYNKNSNSKGVNFNTLFIAKLPNNGISFGPICSYEAVSESEREIEIARN